MNKKGLQNSLANKAGITIDTMKTIFMYDALYKNHYKSKDLTTIPLDEPKDKTEKKERKLLISRVTKVAKVLKVDPNSVIVTFISLAIENEK